MSAKKIVVGMADLAVMRDEGVLTTIGLGSCVGIAIYDSKNKVGGLAHIMLPDSTKIKHSKDMNIAKFADTAIVKLKDSMISLGANTLFLKAKIAGGAQMFKFKEIDNELRIGDRNIEATIGYLKMHRIALIASDVGLNYGRTVELNVATGEFTIKSVTNGIKFI